MQSRYTKIALSDFSATSLAAERFATDVLLGLSAQRRSIPAKYFYDDAGSLIFEEITHTPEYYLTASERDILHTHRAEIVNLFGPEPFNLVELGAGDGHKTQVLLRELIGRATPFRYIPLDISEGAVAALTRSLARAVPGLEFHGIVADYADGIRWLHRNLPDRVVVMFLGSSIGNFTIAESRSFLRTLWRALRAGDLLLIGYDLKKDIDVLLRAYNDAQGVTRRFNLNLLARINRELGADFDLEKFRHFGTYDVVEGAMKSYLVSTTTQTVRVGEIDATFDFAPAEPIHVESSYKYLASDMLALAAASGFEVVDTFHDSRAYFADSLWRVVKAET